MKSKSKNIRISEKLYKFIESQAKGFESASRVLERLLKIKNDDKGQCRERKHLDHKSTKG